MKTENLLTALWAFLMSFVISLAAVACLVTGFDMAVELGTVALWCGIGAAVSTVCYMLPLGLLPAAGTALTAGYLWQSGSLELSVQSLLFRVSRRYNEVYGWGTIRLNMYTSDDMELTLWLGLCLLGVLIAMGVSWAVCRGKTGFAAVLPALVLLGLCFVTRDTVPETAWLYFLLFGILLIMLTHTVRRTDAAQGNRLSFMAVLPLALCLLLLFAAVPREGYTGQALAQDMETAVLENALVKSIFGDLTEKGTTGSSVDSSTVRLDHVGVRLDSQAQILQVETDFSGTVYLRGRALDAYDGISWTSSGASYDNLYWARGDDLTDTGSLTVTTRYAHRMLYIPYYVRGDTVLGLNTGLENTDKLTQYTFTCSTPREDITYDGVLDFDTGEYLHLSDSVKKWAEPLAKELTVGADSVYEKAQAIARYVKNSAVYDLKTAKMPARETDFAKWFLEDSDTGYCIHFATAATVLLQAAGIPARYVTGYAVTAEAGDYTPVRSCDAHAWAEYWIPGFGWTVLEATPPAQAETEPTAAPEQTLPHSTVTPDTPAQAEKTDPLVWIGAGAGILLTAVLVLAVRCLILRHRRRKRLTQGTPQQLALAHWQQITRIARYLGEMPPEAMLAVAQKAKFSPHTPTRQELEMLEDCLADSIRRLKQKPVFYRLWYRVIPVLY